MARLPAPRFPLIAVALLALTQLVTPVLAKSGEQPPNLNHTAIPSLPAPGWVAAGYIVAGASYGRTIQQYISRANGDTANVETRCATDAKGFLNWSGKLGYQGAGYGEVGATTTRMVRLPNGTQGPVSEALMRKGGDQALVLYAYVDHWGPHPESARLWPRAAIDLLARHAGPYCMLGVTVPVTHTRARAAADARQVIEAFLPAVQRLIHP